MKTYNTGVVKCEISEENSVRRRVLQHNCNPILMTTRTENNRGTTQVFRYYNVGAGPICQRTVRLGNNWGEGVNQIPCEKYVLFLISNNNYRGQLFFDVNGPLQTSAGLFGRKYSFLYLRKSNKSKLIHYATEDGQGDRVCRFIGNLGNGPPQDIICYKARMAIIIGVNEVTTRIFQDGNQTCQQSVPLRNSWRIAVNLISCQGYSLSINTDGTDFQSLLFFGSLERKYSFLYLSKIK